MSDLERRRRIAVLGCGYVGLVTAVGFAALGHDVTGFDISSDLVERLNRLDFPIIEPGLQEAARNAPSLRFRHIDEGFDGEAEFVFLALPTPPDSQGGANLDYIEQAIVWLSAQVRGWREYPIVVVRSTAPPGTAEWVEVHLRRRAIAASVVSNPEFLQEGRALQDFQSPSRVLIGGDGGVTARVARLYSFTRAPIICTTHRTAELAKYSANAFLAMRISFANELAGLAEALGADTLTMLRAVGLDPRVGEHYLRPGIGYGGSCLPKDIAALIGVGGSAGLPMHLSRAAQLVNEEQREHAIDLLEAALGGLEGKRVTLLGLAFKPGTNDLRDAPALALAKRLNEAGALVTGWDPATDGALIARAYGIDTCADILDALEDADAAVLCTEWPEATSLDLTEATRVMRGDVFLDGRYAWRDGVDLPVRLLRVGASLDPVSDEEIPRAA